MGKGKAIKNINFSDDVVKTPAIVRSVELLDAYFDGEPSIISSGFRTARKQLETIIEKAKRHGIDGEFYEFHNNLDKEPEFALFVDGYEKAIFFWERTWSKLLSLSDIVNPPVPATVLFDYFRPGSLENKKGLTIGISPHMHGLAFDIKGENRLIQKANRVIKAFNDKNCFLTAYLVEHGNNAIHCDVRQIG